ncbi:MAG: hypothetical protein ISS19_08565 [Bacteroidales bacterium]|nr:hypothetical protein [Bacteroidales bacterium]
MELSAPLIDHIISRFENNSIIHYPVLKKLLADIYLAMSCIKPEGDDEVRELWIEIPRGSIEDFGDFEEYRREGLVDTYEAFEQEWKDYYPGQVKWYGFATAKYREEKFYYINSRLCFTINMADGRHGGLTEIEMDSKEAFRNWYSGGGKTGAHPWEICRGGNSTHISLMVTESAGKWTLRLAGSSIVRVEETVKMAVALYRNNIPFILQEGEAILQMVTGNDYIGIVPDHIFPRYCHGLFPKQDKIIDFMNLGYENTEAIISNSYWYPLKPIIL